MFNSFCKWFCRHNLSMHPISIVINLLKFFTNPTDIAIRAAFTNGVTSPLAVTLYKAESVSLDITEDGGVDSTGNGAYDADPWIPSNQIVNESWDTSVANPNSIPANLTLELAPGEYQWWIRAYSAADGIGSWIEGPTFTIQPN